MRVYNINKAIGLASSGVEYAQRYRREMLAGINWVDDYYVFTDYISTNLSVYSDRLGFARSQVLWIYNLVTGRVTLPGRVSPAEFMATIKQPQAEPQAGSGYTEVGLTGSAVRYRIRTTQAEGGETVDRVETLVGDQLVKVEHYDVTLNNVEHFHLNRLVRRVFYTPSGHVGAEQFYRDREITRTLIKPASPLYDRVVRPGRQLPSSFTGDIVLEGRSQFFQFVFQHLFSRADDVVIVDRALDVIDAVYPVIGGHRLYSVVHAEHFDLKQIEDGVLLWNNHYENVFSRPDMVDGFIVSTKRQKVVLESQLAARFPAGGFRVICIPVGVATLPASEPEESSPAFDSSVLPASSAAPLHQWMDPGAPVEDTDFDNNQAISAQYDPNSIVTASRLADEKHIDVLIRAVSLARRRLPGLRLDVYGEGNRDRLLAVIQETGAQDYVRLMGHRELAGELGSYGLYVSTSWSEGFGLSLLEAMAESLPLVGFDVDYGNRELINPGVNGRLVPCTFSDADAAPMADAIVAVLTSGSLDKMRRQSRLKAEAYTAGHVRRLWEQLLSGEAPC